MIINLYYSKQKLSAYVSNMLPQSGTQPRGMILNRETPVFVRHAQSEHCINWIGYIKTVGTCHVTGVLLLSAQWVAEI